MIWHGSRRRFAPLLAAILIGAVVPGARMAGAAAGAGSAAAGTAPPAVAPLPPPDAEIPPPEPAPREVGKAPPSPAPAQPDAVFCPVCGARNRAGSHFCLKDGTPLPPIDPERFDPRFVRAAETYSPEEIQETIHRTSGSVVRIRVKTSLNLKYPVSGKTGLVGWLEVVDEEARLVGSGFAVGAPGEIVTNAHVVCPFGTPAQISVDTQ
ncbi:MAG TPA: hypothetical protein VFT43_10115, partial [Candidatus Polarisedimenticolia bacterium]|nr:hypothetical protein [Candidatus Polarisedimenticolia bacterium]